MLKQQLLGVILGFALLLTAMIALPLQGSFAAPAAAPTPITAPGAAGTPVNVTFFNAQAIAADTRSNPFEGSAYNRLDLHYVIDQNDAATNTVTLSLQTSCTGQNWDDGVAVVSGNSADAQAVVSLPNFCRYAAIYANVTNTNTLTITVKAVAKQ